MRGIFVFGGFGLAINIFRDRLCDRWNTSDVRFSTRVISKGQGDIKKIVNADKKCVYALDLLLFLYKWSIKRWVPWVASSIWGFIKCWRSPLTRRVMVGVSGVLCQGISLPAADTCGCLICVKVFSFTCGLGDWALGKLTLLGLAEGSWSCGRSLRSHHPLDGSSNAGRPHWHSLP